MRHRIKVIGSTVVLEIDGHTHTFAYLDFHSLANAIAIAQLKSADFVMRTTPERRFQHCARSPGLVDDMCHR